MIEKKGSVEAFIDYLNYLKIKSEGKSLSEYEIINLKNYIVDFILYYEEFDRIMNIDVVKNPDEYQNSINYLDSYIKNIFIDNILENKDSIKLTTQLTLYDVPKTQVPLTYYMEVTDMIKMRKYPIKLQKRFKRKYEITQTTLHRYIKENINTKININNLKIKDKKGLNGYH